MGGTDRKEGPLHGKLLPLESRQHDPCVRPAGAGGGQAHPPGRSQTAQGAALAGLPGEGRFDADACAADIGGSAADCADALQYWAECGLLQSAEGDGEPDKAPARAQAPVNPNKAAPPTAPAPRPRAVKPQFQEVLKRQKESEEFAYLLDTASAGWDGPFPTGTWRRCCTFMTRRGCPSRSS